MIVDMHTHAGHPTRSGPVDPAVLATMRAGGIGAAVVSAIADLPLLRRDPVTRRLGILREPEPGECLASVEAYLADYEASGARIAREPDQIRPDDPALVLAIEGCDFLDGDLDRLDAMEARGVRSIQLTHYRVNETGDIQTAPERHGGLTRFGAEAVRRMNARGIMVDVAHCSETTVRGVVAATTRPILCTHSNLAEPGHKDGAHPRYISRDYARMVADTGGVIGGWIAVLHEEKLPGMIRHILRLIEAVGIDHVGIGTDLPSGAQWHGMGDFTAHPDILARLRAAGLTAEETEKVAAGNWMRVFRAARA
ncbi:MAG: membrane dipeptidase [Rhodospirillales bacterium]|nr:membrane dipeptidase [Rhodospirillales bacterium]